MFAAHEHLGSLVAIVDANGLQIDGAVNDVVQTGTLSDKFRAFGWDVSEVDGNDVKAVRDLLMSLKSSPSNHPQAVIAHTIKGKGVSFMEGQAGWHGKAPNAEELTRALSDLARTKE